MQTVDDDIVFRWPVAILPYTQIDVAVAHEAYLSCVKDTWQYLLDNGKDHAVDAGVRPEELIFGELPFPM